MRGNKLISERVPVAELRRLLTAVSAHGEQHLLEVEADLMQTTFLLSGAIEKLGASFMAIHEAVTAQQEKINDLLNSVDVATGTQRAIENYRENISTEVNAAVTGLQFQDMTSQLIMRAIKRVEGLRESLSALAVHGEGIHTNHEHEEIARLLDEMSTNLSTRDHALMGGLRKSVAQKDMASGDIELF
jgi:chemotaxis regulatin CheY-phosphate phosphatase CheZ